MAAPDLSPWAHHGNEFSQITVNEGAKAHIGHNFSIGRESPLHHLHYASEAPHTSYARQHKPTCLQGTRTEVLEEIYKWADKAIGPSVFWLSGRAGAGKSTIAQTVAEHYSPEDRLGASFFFSRDGGEEVRHATHFVSTVALQLASKTTRLNQLISNVVSKDSQIATRSLHEQWNQLVLRPLSEPHLDPVRCPFLLVVDALDECEEDDDIRAILRCLGEVAESASSARLQIFVTSRPDTPIRLGFRRMPATMHYDLVLHDVSRALVDRDIERFIRHEFEEIIHDYDYLPSNWPGDEKINQLVQQADGLFVYASTVCRFVRGEEQWPPVDLFNLVVLGPSPSQSLDYEYDIPSTSPTWRLDVMYTQIVQQSLKGVQSVADKSKLSQAFKKVIGSIAVVAQPLPVATLAGVLRIRPQDVSIRVQHLHAVLNVPHTPHEAVRISHTSFRDFLLDRSRCKDQDFWVDERQAHDKLADHCIQIMSALKQNICGQSSPGILVSDVDDGHVQKCIPSELQYACLYWIQHLEKSKQQLLDNGQVHRFLLEHLLYWLEAMSWMKKVVEAGSAIRLLESIADASECPELHAFIYDTKRFVTYARPAIEQAPLQTYISATILAPMGSLVRERFEKQVLPRWIKRVPQVSKEWSALLQTLEGHSRDVTAVTLSPHGKQLASASGDSTIRLWDANTGTILRVLEGHLDRVATLAFSPDSEQLASGSYDSTVKLWNVETGASLRTLTGHSFCVETVVFSPNGKQLASGSGDGTVRLWDAKTGGLQMLESCPGGVNAVTFSPDGKQLASTSVGTIRLWDLNKKALLYTFEGYPGRITAVVFSPDGRQLAAGSWNETGVASAGAVTLSDVKTGASLRMFRDGLGWVGDVAFSPDGQQLVSTSDSHVMLWDVETGLLLRKLEGHSRWVNTVAFSPNGKQLASGSDDRTVRLWDIKEGPSIYTLESYSSPITAIVFSPDGERLASGSGNGIVRLWDGKAEVPLQSLQGHLYAVTAVVFSPSSKQLASASWDATVRLWDVEIGALLQVFRVQFDRGVTAVVFSPDGSQLASASEDCIIRLWNTKTGALLRKLEGHSWRVTAITFSPDGKQLASGSEDCTARLWDTDSGAQRAVLELSDAVFRLAFSVDGSHLVTEKGILNIGPSSMTVVYSDSAGSHLDVEEEWIMKGTEKLIWLPPGHRSTAEAFYKNVIALGHESGRVSLWEIDI